MTRGAQGPPPFRKKLRVTVGYTRPPRPPEKTAKELAAEKAAALAARGGRAPSGDGTDAGGDLDDPRAFNEWVYGGDKVGGKGKGGGGGAGGKMAKGEYDAYRLADLTRLRLAPGPQMGGLFPREVGRWLYNRVVGVAVVAVASER